MSASCSAGTWKGLVAAEYIDRYEAVVVSTLNGWSHLGYLRNRVIVSIPSEIGEGNGGIGGGVSIGAAYCV